MAVPADGHHPRRQARDDRSCCCGRAPTFTRSTPCASTCRRSRADGWRARAAAPCRTLAISDVVGDDLERHRVGPDGRRSEHVRRRARRARAVRRRRRAIRRRSWRVCDAGVARRRSPKRRSRATRASRARRTTVIGGRARRDGWRRGRGAARSAITSCASTSRWSARRASRRSRIVRGACARGRRGCGGPRASCRAAKRRSRHRQRARAGAIRSSRSPRPSRSAIAGRPAVARQRRHRRHRRPDRRGRRDRRFDDARRARAAAGLVARRISRRQQRLRVFRRARRSHPHRSDRHQRRRPPGNSVSLKFTMLSRDQILALMRERVHHPAGMRELLQVLKVPRDERTVVQAAHQVARRLRRPDSDSRPALRPAREDGPVRRPAADASGRLRLRHARAAARAAAATSTSPAPHLNEAMHGDRVVVRIERDQGRRPRRRAHHPDPRARPTRRSSAATTATTTAWATSCRSTAAC